MRTSPLSILALTLALAGCSATHYKAESVETRILLPIIGVTLEREVTGVEQSTPDPEPKPPAPAPRHDAPRSTCDAPRDWRTRVICRMDND